MADAGTYDHVYKIILVGDATVGKTHLLSRYVRGRLPQVPQSTVGVEFSTRTIPLKSGGTVKAQLWDTAGQERYRAITSAHYRRAVGALLLYDVTRKQSFLNASKWLDELRQSGEPDILVFLVGNKIDLVDEDPSRREVPTETAAAWAQKNGLFFTEASAVRNIQVKEIFETLMQEIYNKKNQGRRVSEDLTAVNGGLQLTQGVAVNGWNSGYDTGSAHKRINTPSNPFFSCCNPQ